MVNERKRARVVRRAVVEALDRRVLLSTSLNSTARSLAVVGTEGNDVITVSASQFINALVVTENGSAHYYSLSAIASIHMDGKGGDDRLVVDDSLAGMKYACTVYGGQGDDTLTVSGGQVLVAGEGGNDKLRASGSSVTVSGDNGRDVIWTSAGNATIQSGEGNDEIHGGAGKEVIKPGPGNDWADGGGGDDVLADDVGQDTLRGGTGNDSIKGGSQTAVAGGEGNDWLSGHIVYGGNGDDQIYGTNGADTLKGEDGNDMVKGGAGADKIYGGAGDDALFGGNDNDYLDAGEGNDNLYGGGGHTDKNTADDGHDTAVGGAGLDWLDPVHVWRKVDWSAKSDTRNQNDLYQDPSKGQYANGAGIKIVNGSGYTYVPGSASSGASFNIIGYGGGTTSMEGSVTPISPAPAVVNRSLGSAGWLSSGAWDEAKAQFVPPVLTDIQRSQVKATIVQIPRDWQVGAETADGDLVWYRVAIPNSKVTVPARWRGSITGDFNETPGYFVTANGQLTGVAVADNEWAVPTTTGGVVNVPKTTPGLFNGVQSNAYRFIGLKQGSVLVSGSSKVADVKQWPMDSKLVPLASYGDVRVVGQAAVHRLTAEFAHVRVIAKGARGILVEDGAVGLGSSGGIFWVG